MQRRELRRVEGAQVAWIPTPLEPTTYVMRTDHEVAPKTYDVVRLLPAD